MPDSDLGERTEEATPRRRQEARERGNVAKSNDLTVALTLMGSVVILHLAGAGLLQAMALLTRKSLDSLYSGALTADTVRLFYAEGVIFIFSAAAPLLFGVLAVGVAGNLLQAGFIWTSEPLKPDISRLDPVRGLGRLVSKRGFVRLLVSMFKVLLIGVIGWVTIQREIASAAGLVGLSPGEIACFGGRLVLVLGYRVAAALLILALADYAFQRWQYERDLMMTRQELRDELKRMEGDPLTRERRRRMQRQIAMQRMMQKVPKADVVVTNPTELAVAIQYDPEETAAPVCVAKGAGFIAARIREIAAGAGVPIVENKPVAQLLYRKVEVGGEIPVELYQAVAEILAYVYRVKGKTLPEAAA
jgi:flagellar biosynthetic protein FlhB